MSWHENEIYKETKKEYYAQIAQNLLRILEPGHGNAVKEAFAQIRLLKASEDDYLLKEIASLLLEEKTH